MRNYVKCIEKTVEKCYNTSYVMYIVDEKYMLTYNAKLILIVRWSFNEKGHKKTRTSSDGAT